MSASAHILVVDDDAAIALMLRQVLSREGHQVRIATSAEQAMSRFGSQKFDLVITDKHMPDVGGFELIRSLRQLDATLPVILMTAHPEMRQDRQTIQGYLAKPFRSLQYVVETVERTLALASGLKALKLKRAADQLAA